MQASTNCTTNEVMINSQPSNTVSSPTENQPLQQCVRPGCQNQATVSPDWEDEYCSNECVVRHCRDIFTKWVQANNQHQDSYFNPS